MSSLKTIVQKRLEELKRGPVELALERGLSKDFISDILAGKKKSVRGPNLRRLARVLEIQPEALLIDEPDEAPTSPREAPRPRGMPSYDLPRDLPILGTAAGSMVGAIAIAETIGYARRPPALLGVPDAYALYVRGDSMIPRFLPGQLLYINPHRPFQPGDDIVVQVQDGVPADVVGYVKQFARRTLKMLVCKQFNPAADIEYPLNQVIACHRVINGAELIGE